MTNEPKPLTSIITDETRAEMIARYESAGLIDPTCPTCIECVYDNPAVMPDAVFMPHHKASSGCKSGKHPHCSCDSCF